MKKYYLLVFESKNHILYLQSSLELKGQNYFKIVSAPCGLKSGYGCSYALKISNKNYFPMLKKEIDKLSLSNSKMYIVEIKDNKYNYKEIQF